MKNWIFLILIALPFTGFSQEDMDEGVMSSVKQMVTNTSVDLDYLEDQFYVGFTYDYLAVKATNVVQHNLSRGIHAGFLRDIPINAKRTVGFAAGLGYAYDRVYNNMLATKTATGVDYHIVERFKDLDLSRNFFETHTVEFPIEFRYRTSTPESHKFWRVYTGLRLGYIFSERSLNTRSSVSTSFQNPDINKTFQCKAFAVFGYNALNFFVQYNLTPLMKDAHTAEGTSLKSNVLQIGLMFYIL